MQERNFERQVKDRLEEFDLPPSAPVWQKIEREIRRRRERRRLVLWLLPFLLAGGAFLLWTSTGKEIEPVNRITTGKPSQEVPSPGNSVATNRTEKNSSTTDVKQEISAVTPSEKNSTTIVRQQEWLFMGEVIPGSKKSITARKNIRRQEVATGRDDQIEPATIVRDDVQKTEPITPAGLTSERLEINTGKVDTATAVTANAVEQEIQAAPADKPAQEAVKPTEKKEDKKWKIALHASAGYAESAESFFPLTGGAEPMVVPTSIGGTPATPTPSPLRKGLYISTGLQFTKPLSNRISFTTGIQYSYGSTQQMVGNKRMRDSNTTRLAAPQEEYTYYNGSTNSYTNSFHFIELPAGIDVQLFSSLPLELHAGFSVSALLAGNAVHYDRNTNTYYRNNDHLRKTGVNWYSGFSYGLMKNRLKIGPHIQYGFLSLNSKDTEDKKYLLMTGLRAKWMLKQRD